MTTSVPTGVPDPSPAPPAPAAARAVAVTKSYGRDEARVVALDGVDLTVERGRLLAIMGPSGSGKSTLLHCLAGLDTVDSGRVEVDGTDLATLGDDELSRLRRDRVGFVFQSFNLVPTLTAEENIVLPLSLAGRRADRDWLDHVIDAVGLRGRLGHRPSQLSGGQQQRVACARALAARPALVAADEPTGNLDRRSGGEVLRFLRRSVDELGQSVVMVTHDPVAAAHADRVVMLSDGRVVDEMSAPTADGVLDRLKAVDR